MVRDKQSILNHIANRKGKTVKKQDTETGRIVLTNAKNRGKRIDPIPVPDPAPNPDLEQWRGEQERKKNRRTVIVVWLITALLLLASSSFMLWQSGVLKRISLSGIEKNPSRTGFSHIGLPQINSAKETGKLLPALAGDVAQVEVLFSNVVVVLRTDGTVDIAGNSELAAKTASWDNVVKLVTGYDSIAGIRADGTAVCSICDISGWRDIEDIYIHWNGVAGIKTDGTVVTAGTWDEEYDPSGWTNIKRLYDVEETSTIGLKRDGTIIKSNSQNNSAVTGWKNVEEIYDGPEGYHYYARLSDGSFVNTTGENMVGLKGCKKTAADRFVFGVSPDGRLLTQTGKLYTDGGEIHVEPESPYYEEIDISQYTNIRDIVGGFGIILLKKDGTVDWIDRWTNWDLRSWNQIEKIYTDWSGHAYGIHKDGSVIVADSQGGASRNNYMDWKLKELFVGDGGVVGLTTDGRLVGDGTFNSSFLSSLN